MVLALGRENADAIDASSLNEVSVSGGISDISDDIQSSDLNEVALADSVGDIKNQNDASLKTNLKDSSDADSTPFSGSMKSFA